MRTSAEDSFGRATFEEFPVGDSYQALRRRLLERVPATLQGYVRDALQFLGDQHWRWAGAVAQVRYLLCALANGNDGEAFGGALYELGLVPDFKLFDDPTTSYGRIRKNLECVRKLTDSDQSIRSRVLQLDLVNKGLRRRLAEYLVEAGVEDPVAWTREVVLNKTNWDLSFDKWEFASEIAPDKIAFLRVETDLPVVAEDEKSERLVDLIGQQVLAPEGATSVQRNGGGFAASQSGPGAGVFHGPDPVAGLRARGRRTESQGVEGGAADLHGVILQAKQDRV